MTTGLPAPRPDWCLFLDFDGTLVEIADAPDAVRVERNLSATLAAISQALDGALAIVSGRPISEIDHHLDHGGFAAAGVHGLELRRRPGEPVARVDAPPPDAAVGAAIAAFARVNPGLLVEDKGMAIALHYRARPDLADACLAAARHAIEGHPHLQALPGKMVVEIKPAAADKGQAVRRFVEEPPFAGRTPVFVGDDLTDEDGFRAVQALGGFGVKIGDGETGARFRIETVPAFLHWLGTVRGRLVRAEGEVTGS